MVDRSSPDIESLIHKLNRAWRFEYQDPDACGGFIEKITPAEYKSIVDGLGALSAGFAQCSQQWQPISDFTPGHDNPNVLVVDQGVVSEAYYNGEDETWFKAGKSEHDFDFVNGDRLYPTHWMPMPAPPALSVSSTVSPVQDAKDVRQHIAWLFQYVQGMNERNWHDMKLRAERQLERLSLAFPGPSDTSTDRLRAENKNAALNEAMAEVERLRAGLQKIVDFKDLLPRAVVREACAELLAPSVTSPIGDSK